MSTPPVGILSNIAENSFSSSQTLQASVRQAYKDFGQEQSPFLHYVAEEMGNFKTNNAYFIPSDRKKVNNIINDVSRICRELTGYSIANVSRSNGVWKYEPRLTPTRAKPVPKASEPELTSTELWEIGVRAIEAYPSYALQHIMKIKGDEFIPFLKSVAKVHNVNESKT